MLSPSRGSALGPDRPREELPPASPQASRQRRRRWRDPRLWLGMVLILGSVVAGAKVFASADDTVAIWQLVHDVPADSELDASDLRATRARFEDPAVARQYLSAGSPIAPGSHATRDLQQGEMLEAAAVSASSSPVTSQLPLGVGVAHQPSDLGAGDRVDVWAVAGGSNGAADSEQAPTLVLHDVTVLSVGSSLSGVASERQVLIGIGDGVDVGSVLLETTGAQVVLIRLAN